jgi:hypothetical protein
MLRMSHTYAERGLDPYPTSPGAVHALLRVEKLPHQLWEPSAGYGPIVRVLRDAGHAVIASDIRDYGFPLHFTGDFLEQVKVPTGTQAIITNPPNYLMARKTPFVDHALNLCTRVILLTRLAFLEVPDRTDIIEHRGLARIHVFRNRLPMMHRDGWTGPKASNPTCFAWFVWDRKHRGPPASHRISYDESETAGNGRTGSTKAVRQTRKANRNG